MVGYDLRGHGRSDRPAGGYTLTDFVDDLARVLAELGVSGSIHLVGNSFGGTVAFAFAARHPDRVASIISIEAEPPTEVWSFKMGVLMKFSIEILEREDTYAWITANQGTHHARLMRQAHERLTSTSMPSEIPSGTMMGPDDLAKVTCPVLSVIGAHGFQADDPTVLAKMLPNCGSVVIGGQDHSVVVEAHRVVSWCSTGSPSSTRHRSAEPEREQIPAGCATSDRSYQPPWPGWRRCWKGPARHRLGGSAEVIQRWPALRPGSIRCGRRPRSPTVPPTSEVSQHCSPCGNRSSSRSPMRGWTTSARP